MMVPKWDFSFRNGRSEVFWNVHVDMSGRRLALQNLISREVKVSSINVEVIRIQYLKS